MGDACQVLAPTEVGLLWATGLFFFHTHCGFCVWPDLLSVLTYRRLKAKFVIFLLHVSVWTSFSTPF